MFSKTPDIINTWTVIDPNKGGRVVPATSHLKISNFNCNEGEVILDYGRCEGGIPIFVIEHAESLEGEQDVPFRVVYSETRDGIDHDTGDGPFFLFSNAMDTYRSNFHKAVAGSSRQSIHARFLQASQRYQKITLTSPNTSLVFSTIGFQRVRPAISVKADFRCSDPTVNCMWRDGVRTVDMCTVSRGETRPAWDVTPRGTRVYGGHWAPCRQGTRWADKTVTFETKIEDLGASWGIHMVANGVIFCLDAQKKTLEAYLGLSKESGTFPTRKLGSWTLPPSIDTSNWLQILTVAREDKVTVTVQGHEVAALDGVNVRPLLGGAAPNTGSVAFGGPSGWIALYRNLTVTGPDGKIHYDNKLSETDAERTYADFQVGTNQLPCLIDGAKRDRACFGGDAFITGRSIAYSTRDLETWRGSLQLLMSHQTQDGFLGNLCPIQAPEHNTDDEPPTYAFYSLTYALLTIVSTKDYWYHSGDKSFVDTYSTKMQDQMRLAAQFLNQDGLVEAPPPLSMTWFPMGGPIFGPSASINLAYYDALTAMALMSTSLEAKTKYSKAASDLKTSIIANLWDDNSGVLRFSSSSPTGGICQSTNGYASSLGVTCDHPRSIENLTTTSKLLPAAFQDLGHWDKFGVSSPYASGFALEALLTKNEPAAALKLLLRVWGPMADEQNPNYSGAHWEAMDRNGNPFNHDVSLSHGWSTWPVFLLPRYLAGLYPLEPGWEKIAMEPVLAELDEISYSVESVRGLISVAISINESRNKGTMKLVLPVNTTGEVSLPKSWKLMGAGQIQGSGKEIALHFAKE